MGALDPAKIFVILVIALVVLGPERLPKVARQLGGMWHELTKVREQVVSELRDAIPEGLPTRGDLNLPHIPRPTPGSVSGFVSGLMTPTSNAPAEADGAEGDLVPDVADDQWRPEEVTYSASSGRIAAQRERLSNQLRGAGQVIIHPELGDFSFPADDPNMN